VNGCPDAREIYAVVKTSKSNARAGRRNIHVDFPVAGASGAR